MRYPERYSRSWERKILKGLDLGTRVLPPCQIPEFTRLIISAAASIFVRSPMQREGLPRGRLQPELGADWLPPGLSKDSGKRCPKPKELHVRVFPYVKRKGSNFSQQIARRGLRLARSKRRGMLG